MKVDYFTAGGQSFWNRWNTGKYSLIRIGFNAHAYRNKKGRPFKSPSDNIIELLHENIPLGTEIEKWKLGAEEHDSYIKKKVIDICLPLFATH